MSYEQEFKKIHERNKKVEIHKAWEISLFRRIMVTAFIYGMAVLVMWISNVDQIWLASLVPAIGYFLSMITVSPIRNWWIKHFYE
jgi:hypothetical protein